MSTGRTLVNLEPFTSDSDSSTHDDSPRVLTMTTPPLTATNPWNQKNGCDLLQSKTTPKDWTTESLHKLRATGIHCVDQAYVRYADELWHIQLKKDVLKKQTLALTPEALALFDQELCQVQNANRHLKPKELDKIAEITGQAAHLTTKQKMLTVFGLINSAIFALACGISTASAFISLNILTGGLGLATSAAIFIAGTLVNWWLFKTYVPKTLIDLFGREQFAIDEHGEAFTWKKNWKKILSLGLALFFAVSVGLTFAGLSYSSTLSLAAGFAFMAAASPALIYLAPLLVAVTFICMTAMMFKDIADYIKRVNVWEKCHEFLFDELLHINPHGHKNKSNTYLGTALVLRVTLSVLFVGLALWGLFTSMNACAPGVKAILTRWIPELSDKITSALADGITLGLAFIGQIFFGVTKVFEFMRTITLLPQSGPKILDADNKTPEKPLSLKALLNRFAELSMVAINAAGNGLISLVGATGGFARALALIGGTGNSAVAGLSVVFPAEESSIPTQKPAESQSPRLNNPTLVSTSSASFAESTLGLFPKAKEPASALPHPQDEEKPRMHLC